MQFTQKSAALWATLSVLALPLSAAADATSCHRDYALSPGGARFNRHRQVRCCTGQPYWWKNSASWQKEGCSAQGDPRDTRVPCYIGAAEVQGTLWSCAEPPVPQRTVPGEPSEAPAATSAPVAPAAPEAPATAAVPAPTAPAPAAPAAPPLAVVPPSRPMMGAPAPAPTRAQASTPAPRTSEPSPSSVGTGPDDDYAIQDSEERKFLVLINEYRRQNGRGPLALSDTLTQAAQYKSADMAKRNYFGHGDPDNTPFEDRIYRFGYPRTGIGENIALNYVTAERAMDGWKHSEGHNENMLEKDWKAIGMARVRGKGGLYWTTIFGDTLDKPLQAR